MVEFNKSLNKIGLQARVKRKSLGLTQQEASKQLGINYRHYQDIERSKVNLRLDTLCKILAFYRINFSDLDQQDFE